MALPSLQISQTSSRKPNPQSHANPASACYMRHDIVEGSQRAELQERMSLSTMYWLAATAREKLQREADKADHNLRLLVGHANLLDQVLPELEAGEMAAKLHVRQSKDDPGVPESLHKTTNAMSYQKQRISLILNDVDWSGCEDDDMSDEDATRIANGMLCSHCSEGAGFGVPLYRTKIQSVVCVDQTLGESEDENPIGGSLGHTSNLVHLESTWDVVRTAEIIESVQL